MSQEEFLSSVFGKEPAVPFSEEASYIAFVQEMTKYCRCRSVDRPCDGVLAGGPCDDIQDDPWEDDHEYE